MRKHGRAAARHQAADYRRERGRIVFVEYIVARAMAEARKKGRPEESDTTAFMRQMSALGQKTSGQQTSSGDQ